MKEKIKIGIIGVGARGTSMMKNIFLQMGDVEIVGICDQFEDKAIAAQKIVEEKYNKKVLITSNYNDLLHMEEIDAIIIMSGWNSHIDLTIEAMKAGKYVAFEVGGAYDISECYKLVDAYEETKTPCMMLENCCYGRNEMMMLNLVKKGLFGEIVHCTGGYCHDLRKEDLSHENQHYRQLEYVSRNCENYPTHEFGPIAKILGINRGNKMLHLSSVASKAVGLREYYVNTFGSDSEYGKARIKQGDIVTTTITCQNGETIVLTLDTTLPRAYYSRNFTVRGTKGMYEEARQVLFFDGDEEEVKFNVEQYYEKYDHPLHAEYAKLGEKEGHGGMDWLVCRAFVESVKRSTQTPIDVYDAAAWMCITPLSEQSIALGGMPIPIPDFTRGKWIRREPVTMNKYSLDEICVDDSVKIY